MAPSRATVNGAKAKGVSSRATGERGSAEKKRGWVSQTDVPTYSLTEAIKIPQAIADNYGKAPTKPLRVAQALDRSPSSHRFRSLCGSAIAYGLTSGGYNAETIALTDLGKRIVAPTKEGDAAAARREAMLKPRVLREFLTKYNDSRIPTDQIARNVLEEMGVAPEATARTLELILQGANDVGFLRDVKGQKYVDLEGAVPPADVEAEQGAPYEDREPDAEIDGDQARRQQSPPPPSNDRVFISHGKNQQIREQLKELLVFGKFQPIVSVERETTSKPVPHKVMGDMRSCFAGIIHVGAEEEFLDQEGKAHKFVNQNVLIEIGAAMALYDQRFILLVEEGATLPSNLQGLYEVRYTGEKLNYEATMKLLRAFNEFRPT